MIIDVKKLNAQKKYRGEISFDYSAPEELVSIPFVQFSSPVKVEIAYEIFSDDAVEIKGKLSYALKGQCSRCLKDAETQVTWEIDALFEVSETPEDYSYDGVKIFLTEAIDDAIMASMPFSLSCGKDCEPIAYSK